MRGTYGTHGRYEMDVNKCGIDNVCVSVSFGEFIYIHIFLCIVICRYRTVSGPVLCPRDYVRCLMNSI